MTPGYKLTVRDYGEKDVEVTWGRSGMKEGKRSTGRGKSKKREINCERCIRRAKATVRRKVMAAGLDHLLTLTYRANVVDKAKALPDFERFIRLVHTFFICWPYVMVPERQKRGAYHFHLAVKGFQDVALLRSLWKCIVGEGNIDVQYRKTGKGYQWKKTDLARYLAKYVGKEMESELNERRYRCSLGIEIPGQTERIPLQMKAKDFAVLRLEAIAGRVGHIWCPEESHGEYGWACSWG
jgi:hypothetical protein